MRALRTKPLLLRGLSHADMLVQRCYVLGWFSLNCGMVLTELSGLSSSGMVLTELSELSSSGMVLTELSELSSSGMVLTELSSSGMVVTELSSFGDGFD